MTGILSAAAKITTVVTRVISREKDAPMSAHSRVTDLSDLRLCLRRLVPFIHGKGPDLLKRSPQEAVSKRQLMIFSTSLLLSISQLEKNAGYLEARPADIQNGQATLDEK